MIGAWPLSSDCLDAQFEPCLRATVLISDLQVGDLATLTFIFLCLGYTLSRGEVVLREQSRVDSAQTESCGIETVAEHASARSSSDTNKVGKSLSSEFDNGLLDAANLVVGACKPSCSFGHDHLDVDTVYD